MDANPGELRFSILLGICLLVGAGKALSQNYSPPPDMEKVVVRLSSSEGKSYVKVFESQGCREHRYGLQLAQLPEPYDPKSDAKTYADVQLVAGEPLALTFIYNDRDPIFGSMCPFTVVFLPLAGVTYHAHFVLERNLCRIAVYRLGDADTETPKWEYDSTTLQNEICLDETEIEYIRRMRRR